jgi:high-affinity K+ transport system ATPase subunit B
VFSFLFTPIGRYVAIGMLVLGLTSCVIYKIRADAIAEIEAKATADVLRRTQDAVRAGDTVDTSPDGLLKSDGHRRD